MAGKIESFRDLEAYREACKLDDSVFLETRHWPAAEKFALIDQVRRSSRSVGANLAEAWAKRRYPAHFVSKLTDADGELQETSHWLSRAEHYGYLAPQKALELNARCRTVGRLIGGMMAKPESFALRA
jgi:four helix bundle protein